MRGSLLRSCRAAQTAPRLRSAAVPPRVPFIRTSFAAMATSSSRPPRPAAEVAADMLKFIDASVTQFHAVGED